LPVICRASPASVTPCAHKTCHMSHRKLPSPRSSPTPRSAITTWTFQREAVGVVRPRSPHDVVSHMVDGHRGSFGPLGFIRSFVYYRLPYRIRRRPAGLTGRLGNRPDRPCSLDERSTPYERSYARRLVAAAMASRYHPMCSALGVEGGTVCRTRALPRWWPRHLSARPACRSAAGRMATSGWISRAGSPPPGRQSFAAHFPRLWTSSLISLARYVIRVPKSV